MKSRAYRAVDVNQVNVSALLKSREKQSVEVGLDIGKERILVMLRWGKDDFERPWRVSNPGQLRLLVEQVSALGQDRVVRVGMEPTGTYGDALRQAFADAKIEVWRVSPKASSDYAEIFDGVPSQHDGKDAAVVAELMAHGHSVVWAYRTASALDQELRYQVALWEAHRQDAIVWLGRLEALLSRHWPEATRIVKLSSSALVRSLHEYGGPLELGLKAAEAQEKIGRWGRRLSDEKVSALVKSAQTTMGIRQGSWDQEAMRHAAGQIVASRDKKRQIASRVKELVKDHGSIPSMSEVVGTMTASVLWVQLGDPKSYHCGPAYRKAMGLNLAERSSGQYEGKLKISKRGSSRARRWLYLSALRWTKQEPMKSWFAEQKKARRGVGKPALVAMMRKLALALYQVSAREQKFDRWSLHPGKDGLKAKGPRALGEELLGKEGCPAPKIESSHA